MPRKPKSQRKAVPAGPAIAVGGENCITQHAAAGKGRGNEMKWLILIGGLVVVALIVVGLYFLVTRLQLKPAVPAPTPELPSKPAANAAAKPVARGARK